MSKAEKIGKEKSGSSAPSSPVKKIMDANCTMRACYSLNLNEMEAVMVKCFKIVRIILENFPSVCVY